MLGAEVLLAAGGAGAGLRASGVLASCGAQEAFDRAVSAVTPWCPGCADVLDPGPAQRRNAPRIADRPRRARVGGEEVELIGETELSSLRAAVGLELHFLDAVVHWADLAPTPGKGGGSMLWTSDAQWVVKQLSAGDRQTLSDAGFRERYVRRLLEFPESRLGRIVMAFRRPADETLYSVTGSVLPALPQGARWEAVYDFKGSADDKQVVDCGEPVPQVHLGAVRGPLRALAWDSGRAMYEEGKRRAQQVLLAPEGSAECAALLDALDSDATFLERESLMDYSAVVGVYALDGALPAPQPRPPEQFAAPVLVSGRAIYVGIIDFLQPWTAAKIAANVAKSWSPLSTKPISTVPPPQYSRQFRAMLRRRLGGGAPAAAAGAE
eukprot:TRINITY_DN14966_c0_g1_i1.p1 TRINITY_DN14966_c0_g1~~TRINITY_DN14966_c0_g1_i1.p1  ORF type:complete len:410 (+),score=90.36 TRINITY_DN14966_c0_g1_i1:88-1230(+)